MLLSLVSKILNLISVTLCPTFRITGTYCLLLGIRSSIQSSIHFLLMKKQQHWNLFHIGAPDFNGAEQNPDSWRTMSSEKKLWAHFGEKKFVKYEEMQCMHFLGGSSKTPDTFLSFFYDDYHPCHQHRKYEAPCSLTIWKCLWYHEDFTLNHS